MQKKLSEISSFEVILCLSVVMIHILSESVAAYAKGSVLSVLSFSVSRMLTFVVPGFMISAGIKFANKFYHDSFNYFSFIKTRITKIYLPYVVFSIIYYLYFVFYRNYFDFSFIKLVDYLIHGSVAAPFYFIVLIMQFYILSPFIMIFYRILPSNIGIFFAAIINIASMYFFKNIKYSDRIFLSYFLYWIIGCYIGMDFRTSISRLRRFKKPLLIIGIVLTVIYIGLSYAKFCGIFDSFFTEVIKVGFCVSVSLLILVLMPTSTGFAAEQIAPVTFYIYLIHCLIIVELQHLLTNWGITNIPLRFVIIFFATYVISLLISIFYLKHKNGIRHSRRYKF